MRTLLPMLSALMLAVGLAISAAPAVARAALADEAMAPAAGPMDANAAPEAKQTSAVQSYVLGPEDVIEVDVLGRADFRTRARIGQDGNIQLPLLGVVPASNRTSNELGEQIAKALEAGGYFSHPIVKVDIVGFASKYVIVLGAVQNPGLVPVDRPYRLSEVLARVGGVREGGSDYVVLRPANGAERRLAVRDLATGGDAQDPYVSPGDKIYAPSADVFYISGQVKSPGVYPVASEMTLRMAIAKGGGVTDLGTDKRVQLTRKGKKLSKFDLEGKIEPGDVIVVGERLF